MYNAAQKEIRINTVTYTSARAKLADAMNSVCDDHEPVIITRNGRQAVVMISLDDYKSLEETSYLLRNPKNAKRLIATITSLENGIGKEQVLIP